MPRRVNNQADSCIRVRRRAMPVRWFSGETLVMMVAVIWLGMFALFLELAERAPTIDAQEPKTIERVL